MGFLLGGLKIIYWFFYIVFAIDLIAFSSKIIFYPNTVSSYGFWWFCFLYTLSPFLYFCRGFFQDFICSINIGGLRLNEYKLGAFIFAIIGIFLFYIFFIGHSNNQDDFSFTIKPNRPMPDFLCKANTFYEIDAEHGIYKLKVNNNFYEVPQKRKYYVRFDKDTNLGIDSFIDGVWFKSADINIKKLSSEPSINQGIFIFITPEKYSDYFIPVIRGMNIKFSIQKELFYMGKFVDNNLKEQNLMRKEEWRSWFNYDAKIKFKAAEVPFFLYLTTPPYMEKMNFDGKDYLNAIYINSMQTIKTDFWLDKEDTIRICYRGCGDKIEFLTNDDKIDNLYCNSFYAYNNVKSDGYLIINNKNDQTCIIDKIIISRGRKWTLNLNPGEEYTIHLDKGDIISSRSSSRYYVNDNIKEADKTYQISRNGDITFKSSVDPQPIFVNVISRRGY